MNRCDIVRQVRKPYICETSNSETLSKTILYKSIDVYNKLPDNIRLSNPKTFNKNISKYVRNNFPPFEIIKN